MSALVDYSVILDWLENFEQPPQRTFITLGEPEAASSLRMKIENRLGWWVTVPQYLHEAK